MTQRFWEIDFFRGMAVIAMVAFHFLFDLNYFAGYGFNLHSGFWWAVGRFSGTSFLLLVGLSLAISYSRAKKEITGKELFLKYFSRGIKVFCLGLLITLFTFLFFPQGTIFFGILHLIGFSIILSFPFLGKKYSNLFFGAIILLLGLYLQNFSFDFPWLLWLGFFPENLYTFDYYPLLPWFGIVLFGIFLGNLLYPKSGPRFPLPSIPNLFPINLVCFLGRNSLGIYFIHQPILVAIVFLLLTA